MKVAGFLKLIQYWTVSMAALLIERSIRVGVGGRRTGRENSLFLK